jgi:hypothetical protein
MTTPFTIITSVRRKYLLQAQTRGQHEDNIQRKAGQENSGNQPAKGVNYEKH